MKSDREKEFERLMTDESFISWVKGNSATSQYWESWMKANPCHRDLAMQAREVILALHYPSAEGTEKDKQDVLVGIIAATDSSITPYASRNYGMGRILGIAASLVIATVVTLYFTLSRDKASDSTQVVSRVQTIKETPRGVKMQSVLPDGTKVWINSETRLSFDSDFGIHERVVSLSGEAFFDVTEDPQRPFKVLTKNLSIQALGTSFNIRTSDQVEEVALVTGVLQVEKDENKLIMNSGEKISARDGGEMISKYYFNYDEEIGWKQGLIYFKDADFTDVISRLESWYGVSISSQIKNNKDWNYTGTFRNQSLELVLTKLAFTEKFVFRIEGNRVILSDEKPELKK